MTELYIGLMSGTSLDGVDGVLVDFSGGDAPCVVQHASAPFPAELRAELLALNTPGANELHRAALAGNGLMRVYAAGGRRTCWPTPAQPPASVRAIGAHGQTVRHRPQEFDGTGYTLQLCQPALLAELTGIDVVADFRSRDVAAGGQGAPLAPFFHQALFGRPGETVGVLNIGGISNLTLLRADGADAGLRLRSRQCADGQLVRAAHAASPTTRKAPGPRAARSCRRCWTRCWPSRTSRKAPPKSTGRDLFNPAWLRRPSERLRRRRAGRCAGDPGGAHRAAPAPRTCCATQPDLRR